VKQSHPEAPAKVALLWAAHNQLGLLPLAELRERADALLANPLVVPAFPQYLSGFVQALEPAPVLSGFVVELLSKAFARLPDRVLLPWLPTLITTFKEQAGELVPVLIREAGRTFPATLPGVDAFVPPWEAGSAPRTPAGNTGSGPATDLVRQYPEPVEALAALLGCTGTWQEEESNAAAALLAAHPDTAQELARLLSPA